MAVTYGSGSSAGTYRGYDTLGRVVLQYQQTDSINYQIDATYNRASGLASETYPSVPGAGDRRTVSFTPDAAGRLASLSSSATSYAPAASVSSIGYAPHNALTSETYGNSLVHAVTYNNRLQPNEIKLGTGGAPTSVVSLSYNYGTTNNNGNLQTVTYSGGGLSYTQTFGYDQLNRLTTSVESGGSWSQTNAYDRYGNRWVDLGGGSQNLSFNTANNRITNAGYAYDSAGNLTYDGTQSFTFDAENKISKVTNLAAYTYDGEGQRVRKFLGENLRFVYGIGGQLIAEFSGANGTLSKEYIYGASGLVATIEPTSVNSNGTRYTTSDHLGSPRVVTTSSAGVASRHDYMPFGQELFSGGRTIGIGYGAGDGLRQQFTLKERDIETGLDYFLARYYSSTQGRFTSPDEFTGGPDELFEEAAGGNPTFYADLTDPQSLNKYHYGYNNPLRYVDPDGHQGKETVSQILSFGGQVVKDTVVGGAKGVANVPIDTTNLVNNGVNFAISPLTDFKFHTYQRFEASTPGEQGAMIGVDVGMIMMGGVSASRSAAAGIESSRVAAMTGEMRAAGAPAAAVETTVATTPYVRPANATTTVQKALAQGKPCAVCGESAPKMYAGHKEALVKEYYRTGTINKTRMRDPAATRPECPTCSNREGAAMARYSKAMKNQIPQ